MYLVLLMVIPFLVKRVSTDQYSQRQILDNFQSEILCMTARVMRLIVLLGAFWNKRHKYVAFKNRKGLVNDSVVNKSYSTLIISAF